MKRQLMVTMADAIDTTKCWSTKYRQGTHSGLLKLFSLPSTFRLLQRAEARYDLILWVYIDEDYAHNT